MGGRRIKNISGTRAGGLRAAAKIKEKYGEDFYKKAGYKGAHARVNPYKGFKEDPSLAKMVGSIGGHRSHRCRIITPADNMRDDEWAFLLKMSNRAAGELRQIDKVISAVDQHNVYYAVSDYWQKGDWVSAVTKVCNHRNYFKALLLVVQREFDNYSERVEGQPRRSRDRESLRVIRNVRKALITLGEENGELKKD